MADSDEQKEEEPEDDLTPDELVWKERLLEVKHDEEPGARDHSLL